MLRWRALAAAATFALCGAAAGAAGEPLWFEAGRPGPLALQAVQRLAGAGSHGLDPRDYHADALHQAVARALRGPPPDAAAAERLDRALTAAMQRYLTHLHRGRVDPREVHHHFASPRRDEFDAEAALRAALAARRLELAEQGAVPQVPQYARLREALARHRALEDHPAWHRPLPPLPSLPRSASGRPGKLEPGQPWSGLAPLAQRLLALGDLPAPAPAFDAEDAVYDATLVNAVQRFQQRHGLLVDGIVGAATLQQLQVTPAARVRQIELTLERLRWTPLLHGPRMIVINVPEFVLRAYEVEGGRVHVR
ncbi:MAG TPA: peptidoglycan-binding protein, partial [Rubrivivax sp.]|nr:peptidoglycan-binding protein [Rubrivivax sp.]